MITTSQAKLRKMAGMLRNAIMLPRRPVLFWSHAKRTVMLMCLLAGMSVGLSACVSSPSVVKSSAPTHLFADDIFIPINDIPTVDDIFYLPDDVITEVKRDFATYRFSRQHPMPVHEWLAHYINAQQNQAHQPSAAFNTSSLTSINRGAVGLSELEQPQSLFRYQDYLTQVASKTFAQRAGNCMSLVVMTAALANALAINTQYYDIAVEPMWDKQGDFYLMNGHVNLLLLAPENQRVIYSASRGILVDFMPAQALRAYAKVGISQSTLITMFYNNMAAESLVSGDINRAYALVTAGLKLGEFTPALNTLAVIYRRKGDNVRAEQVYRYALQRDSNDMTTLYNLAVMLGEQNRLDEWAKVHKVLELERIKNPYYYYDMAQQAYDEHNYTEALTWYRRALDKADYRHEFFFGISQTYWALGDTKRAKVNMQKALALSPHNGQQRYQMKLQAMAQH